LFLNYSFFHSVAEIFSIVIAGGIFMITWNSRRYFENHYLLFIGIAYFFFGIASVVHLNTFWRESGNSNLGYQVIMIGDVLYAATFLLAPFLVNRKIRAFPVFLAYSLALLVLFGSVFVWKLFPDCWAAGKGPTTFKTGVEYAELICFAGAMALLFMKRKEFEPNVLRFLMASLAVALVSGIPFSYLLLSKPSIFASRHILEASSSYLVYRAIVVTGFVKPYQTLFKDLKQKEEALTRVKDGLEARVKERTEKLLKLTDTLQSEIDERVLAEEELKMSTRRLDERARELNCLYSLGNVMRKPGITVPDIFEALKGFVPQAFGHPGLICVRLVYKGTEFKSCNFRIPCWRRSADIHVQGRKEGFIEVSCLKMSQEDHCPALDAHEDFIKALARQLGETLELWEAEEALRNRERQQAVVAELGQKALSGVEPEELIQLALSRIRERLEVEECGYWDFSLDKDAPFIPVNEIKQRKRLKRSGTPGSASLFPDEVRAGGQEGEPMSSASVLIKGAKEPFGLIGVYSRPPRTFSPDDIHFLEAMANVLAQAMQRREAEAQKARLESVAQAVNTMDNIGYIFTGIRHEIGNPVNSIKTALTILRNKINTCPRETISEYVDRSIQELTRMEYLLKALKNFNMYESLELKNINLYAFLREFLSLIKPDFLEKGIRVSMGPISETEVAWVDPRALQQVLLNLMTNAVDALEGREGPWIKIEAFRTGSMAAIRIEDNGCGISREHQKELFIPFHTTKPQGTGLGLVIARKMLARMEGTINIKSEEGRGTVVEITVPASHINIFSPPPLLREQTEISG
jgi:signal transduction histidine kinase